ncbi:MAG: hypothetical protein J6V44_13450 [Methanobrevibacter sp.]|nr:hypothetical protein [Methanobrevibacter sp.]
MVYIWVRNKDKNIIKQLNGSTFKLDELIQVQVDAFTQNLTFTFVTDENDKYTFDLDIKVGHDEKCSLRYFGITSPQKHFATGINGTKGKNTMEDLNEFINSQLNPIRDVFDKKFKEENKLKGIEKDFE